MTERTRHRRLYELGGSIREPGPLHDADHLHTCLMCKREVVPCEECASTPELCDECADEVASQMEGT